MPFARPPRRFAAGAEVDTGERTNASVTRLRRLALIGVLSGLAAFIPYVEPIPWLELQTLVVFAAGYLLGARTGGIIGALAAAFYSLANPQGMVHPLILVSQIVGRGMVGLMGGWSVSLGYPRALWARAIVLALWGVGTALVFDIVTNLATGVVFGQIWRTLIGGIAFGLGHLISNTVLFVIAGIPLIRVLEPRRAALVGGAILFLFCGVSESAAQSADTTGTAGPTPSPVETVGEPQQGGEAVPDGEALRDSVQIQFREPRQITFRSLPWSYEVGARTYWRRTPMDPDDNLNLLGAAPRFYGDRSSAEPVRIAAYPGSRERLSLDGVPQAANSTPWLDPGWISDGARATWAWSPLGRSSARRLPQHEASVFERGREAGPGAETQAGLAATTVDSRQGRPSSPVWIGLGDFRRNQQGFNLKVWQSIAGVPLRVTWSAWTRRTDAFGELGRNGAHGIEVGLAGIGPNWRAEAFYESDRASVSDINRFIDERRALELGWGRIDWRGRGDNTWFGGLAASLVHDRVTGEKVTGDPLRRVSEEAAGSVWIGKKIGPLDLTGTVAGSRQELDYTLGGDPFYQPGALGQGSLSFEARFPAWLGQWRLVTAVENDGTVTAVVPQVHWWSRGESKSRLFVSVGGTRKTALAEAGKLGDPNAGPVIERPNGWVGIVGVRHQGGVPTARQATRAYELDGTMSGGELDVQLAVMAWTLDNTLFPAYGLFAREILEGFAATADVEGAAILTQLEWAPIRGLETNLTGYATAREVPSGSPSAAPDYYVALALGPRFHLFDNTLELVIQGEANVLGERLASDAVLDPVLRVGGRVTVGFRDAWLVLRAVDLDNQIIPLPGRRLTGERLESAGRQLRLYGEWRLLD